MDNYAISNGMHKMMQSMAAKSTNPLLREYAFYDDAVELAKKVPKGSIFLGAADEEFSTEPVFIDATRRFTMLILGTPGTGKTNMMSHIMNQMSNELNRPCLVLDAKREFHTQSRKSTDSENNWKLLNYGLRPQGLNMSVFTPEFCIDEDEKGMGGTEYILDFIDMKKIPKRIRLSVMMSLLNFTQSNGNAAARTLGAAIDELPDRVTDFIKASEQGRLKVKASSALMNELRSRVLSRTMGYGTHVYFPREMQPPGEKPRAVVLQLDDQGEDSTISSYAKLALMQVLSDRTKVKHGTGTGYLTIPPAIFIDEVDQWCPSRLNTPSRRIIEKIPLKYRDRDVSLICATQKPFFVSSKLLNDVNYIITGKIRTNAEAQLLINRGVDPSIIEYRTKRLKWVDGDPVKQLELIKSNSEAIDFYAPKCGAQLFQEDVFVS